MLYLSTDYRLKGTTLGTSGLKIASTMNLESGPRFAEVWYCVYPIQKLSLIKGRQENKNTQKTFQCQGQNYRYLIEVDCSSGQFKFAKLKDKKNI